MFRQPRISLSRSAIAAYLCICAALLLLLGLTVWSSYRDIRSLRATLLETELNHLRSQAERTVGRIERDLEVGGVERLRELGRDGWLRRHWEQLANERSAGSYAALIDPDGNVVVHTDPSRSGKRLARSWYDRVLFEFGMDVVQTQSPLLGGDQPSYDVRVPIRLDGREIGEYHAGFQIAWFDRSIAEQHQAFLRQRALAVGAVLVIVLLAATSLYYIAAHSLALRRTVETAFLERATEVGKLAAGLAHEIRNPLHAIQLNLHSLRRADQKQVQIPQDEKDQILEQSTREIHRIEELMRQLVGFATPTEPRDEVINLTSQLREIVDFLGQEMCRSNIELRLQAPSQPVWVRFDHGRLRQVLLNLLQNAQQAITDGGQIQVGLTQRRNLVELTVSDSGAGISEEHRGRIFEPFYSTKAGGTGLGLALVKRFVEEVGGKIRCEPNPEGGVTFRIRLREARLPRRDDN